MTATRPDAPGAGTGDAPDGQLEHANRRTREGAGGGVPLSRNRNYRLLWVSQVLSELGFNATLIAFPLLVLAITGSAAASGLVLGADAAAQLLFGLPAGALADRWDRKKIMLGCEAVHAATAATLVVTLWTGTAGMALLVTAAVVMGGCRALFEPAEDACLPRLVPQEQVPAAVAMNAARTSLAQLSGTALGGVLFGLGRMVPFAADALGHATAFGALLALRVPPSRASACPPSQTHETAVSDVRNGGHAGARGLRREIADGLRWVWRRREIRATAACAVSLNLFFNAYYLVIIVLTSDRGVPAGAVGVMAAMLGAGGLLGSLVAPRLHRRLGPYRSIIGVFWALTALAPVALLTADPYLTGLLFAGMALLAPTANTTITTHQLLLTPDRLRGRLAGAMGVATGTAAAAGPALGGVLLQLLPGAPAVLACTAGIAAVTVLVTASPTLRHYPGGRPGAPADRPDPTPDPTTERKDALA